MNKLAIIKFGYDVNAESYLKAIKKRLGEENISVFGLTNDVDKGVAIELVTNLNKSDRIEKIMLMHPLPKRLEFLDGCIDRKKDIENFYRVTPTAIFKNLCEMVELYGKTVCILNRTDRIGRPLANMLIDAGATVCVCNSKTDKGYLSDIIQYSDIVISATNGKETFRPIPNQIVVDVSNDLGKYKNETNRFKYISTSVVGRWTLEELERRLNDE